MKAKKIFTIILALTLALGSVIPAAADEPEGEPQGNDTSFVIDLKTPVQGINVSVQYRDETQGIWTDVPDMSFDLTEPAATVTVEHFDTAQYGTSVRIVLKDFAQTFTKAAAEAVLPSETIALPDGLFDLQLSEETKQILKAGAVYTGAPIEPEILLNSMLTEPAFVDPQYYEVIFADNTNAGKATVSVTPKMPFVNGCAGTFKISQFKLAKSNSKVEIPDQTYTGKALKPDPKVTVTIDGKSVVLKKGTDYSVAYADNKNIGKATATITGKGNFKGTLTKTFKITYPVKKLTIEGVENKVYTGKEIKQNITVKNGKTVLVKGTDYKVSYENNIGPGKAYVVVTGKGYYTGSKKNSFKITKSITKTEITGIKNKTYTGSEVKQKITVKDGTKVLKEGTDYTVYYKNNVGPGSASVTVKGKGYYTDKVKKSFMIRKRIGETSITGIKDVVYNGKKQTFDIVVKDGSKTLKEGTDYTVSYKNNKYAGTGTVTIRGKGNYKDKAVREFEIKKAPLTEAILKYDSMEYTGSARTQTDTTVVKSGSMVLKVNTDYTVTYKDNVKPGKATMTIEGKDNFTGKLVKTYTITKYKIKSGDVKLEYTTKPYAGRALQPKVTVTAHYADGKSAVLAASHYTVKYENNTAAGTAKAIVTGKGDDYKGTVTKKFKITPVEIRSVTLSKQEYTYDGTEKKPAATVKAVVNGKETTLKENTDYALSYMNNTKAGVATAVVKGKGNFTGTVNATFRINPAAITGMTLAQTSFTYTGSEIRPAATVKSGSNVLKAGTDYSITYTSNVNAGTAVATVKGTGNYSGTESETFIIHERELSGQTQINTDVEKVIKIRTNQQYPTVISVKDNGRTLTKDVDYTIEYTSLDYTTTQEETAYVIIRGRGNYAGAVQKPFLAMDPSKMTALDSSGRDITKQSYGLYSTPVSKLKYQGSVTIIYYEGKDFTVAYSGNEKVGTAYARIKGKSKPLKGLDKLIEFRIR